MRWLLLEPRCVVSREHTHAAWYVCSLLADTFAASLARRPRAQALNTPLEALVEAVGYHFVVYTLRTVRERALSLSRAGGALCAAF